MKKFLIIGLVVFMVGLLASTKENYKRPADQTYLTYPEWFLVFSPEEYAYFLQEHPSYDFPYLGHLSQFWKSYKVMYDKTVEKGYDFNTGYHVMIMVIGLSTTVEYTIKGLYGILFGRMVGLTQTHGRTSEQVYGAKVAKEYVTFIKDTPWYAFDFAEKWVGIYTENDFFGKDFVRKSERKFALSVEYGVKFIYAQIIGFFTKMGYEAPSLKTEVILKKGEVKKQALLPRYDRFKEESLRYAKEGYNFTQIAGNSEKTSILLSIVTDNEKVLKKKHCLLKTKILSEPLYYRCLFEREIGQLGVELRTGEYTLIEHFLPAHQEVKLEHIFDF